MVKVKVLCFFLLALILSSAALTAAGRPQPGFSGEPAARKDQNKVGEIESCDGIEEDECLMRRTLVAHTDYIYTQNHNP